MLRGPKVRERTRDVESVSGLGHQAPWPGGVEEGGRVVDFDSCVGSVVRFEVGSSQVGEG
jgi:hypothetical protein